MYTQYDKKYINTTFILCVSHLLYIFKIPDDDGF